MKIKEMFEKNIDRDLQGVIMVGQDEKSNKKQELEEYVVTRELQRHFADFFENYTRSLDQPTEKVGAWIDGFFGSGKSHFLKIISYLLENEEVDGKYAIDYFKDDNKIVDPATVALMDKVAAAAKDTDVALFNIDSKAGSDAKKDNHIILNVFRKVFNEKRGYYGGNQRIAKMEEELDRVGKFQAFQDEFLRLTASRNFKNWQEARNHYAFNTNDIKEALVSVGFMTEENAQAYVNNLDVPVDQSIEDFAQEVKDYLDSKGPNHRWVFLVDEVGQFIGDDLNNMLNLQSIVEELGSKCMGRAWVIVTSQQSIDQVVDVKNGKVDFSKIQGRFNTRISMSSANVDEVIKKRLLQKTPGAENLLEEKYQNEGNNLKNKLMFKENKHNYPTLEDGQGFAEVYPFLPYQFELLQSVLEAVRTNGADGKHLSEGERSMLATFKEAAQRYENYDDNALIPFSAFFNGLANFLDHNHSLSILHAEQDEYINQDGEDKFTIDVLKTLFMVKYVKEFKSNINNLVTLLLDNISESRDELTKKVTHSLKLLESQNYVLKNTDDSYEFLTNVEQDVNNEINNENVDDSQVQETITTALFANGSIPDKYAYPKFKNRYVFLLNRYLDDKVRGNTRGDLELRVYSPLSDKYNDEAELTRLSIIGNVVVIRLADEGSYIENIRRLLKIDSYVRKNYSLDKGIKSNIINGKQAESASLRTLCANSLKSALEHADIYYNGSVVNNGKNFDTVIKDTLQKVVDAQYRFLNYIEVPKTEADIVTMFKDSNDLGLVAELDNSRAVEEILKKIKEMGKMTHTIQSLINKFTKMPYGFIDDDVEWILSGLFVEGKIRVENNRVKLTVAEAYKDPHTYAGYFTKKSNREKTTVEPQKEVAPRAVKQAKEFAMDLLDVKKSQFSNEDTPTQVQKVILDKVEHLKGNLKHYDSMDLRVGQNYLEQGIKYLDDLQRSEQTDTFFDMFPDEFYDEYDEWNEEMERRGILEFYKSSESQKIWKTMEKYISIYEKNGVKQLLSEGDEIGAIIDQYDELKRLNNPSKSVPQIKQLNNKFIELFNVLVDKKYAAYQEKHAKIKDLLEDRLAQHHFEEKENQKMRAESNKSLEKLEKEAKKAADNGKIQTIIFSIDKLNSERDRLTKLFEEEAKRIAAQNQQNSPSDDPTVSGGNNGTETPKPTPAAKVKVTSTKRVQEVVADKHWKIESDADINRYLADLRKQLEKEKEGKDVLNVDFE